MIAENVSEAGHGLLTKQYFRKVSIFSRGLLRQLFTGVLQNNSKAYSGPTVKHL